MMEKLTRKIYSHYIMPEEYPLFHKRHAKAVTREALQNEIQFTTLRVLTSDKQNRLTDIENDIEIYVEKLKLGKILWPVYTTLLAENFKEFVDIVAQKGLYLFDFWGYVPGCLPQEGVIWGEYSVPNEFYQYMMEKLGDRFLGFDNGEQDGRYVGSFAHQQLPLLLDRKKQYRNFQKHFQKLGDAMQNHMVTLASLTFLHYFAKEGNTIMLGAETAQALPNNNMWFSFIRGASRQYGFLYYGNASVWNRWGYKSYESEGNEPGYEWGPECGTSLSLLRRLMYSQYMYNCDVLGFESSWVVGDNTEKRLQNIDVLMETQPSTCILSPVGKIQNYAIEFVEKNGRPGVFYAPLAIVTDFYSGWVPPRHLYTTDVYKVWGNLPYEMGDFQLDLIFSMLYPGYENAGFYRDERGFSSPTPYGDIADLLLSDATADVLKQYSTILITSGTALSFEMYNKLAEFAAVGGSVILFGETIKNYYDQLKLYDNRCSEFFGIDDIGEFLEYSDVQFEYGDKKYNYEALRLLSCKIETDTNLVVYLDEKTPVITMNRVGSGSVSVILTEHGMYNRNEFNGRNEVDEDIVRPYELYSLVRDYLDGELKKIQLISIDNSELQYDLCVKNSREFTLLVANNTFEAQGFDIGSSLSPIASVREIEIEDNVKSEIGYMPKGVIADTNIFSDQVYSIDSGDVRIFNIMVKEADLEFEEEIVFAGKANNLFLAKPQYMETLKDAILLYPEFNQHFCGLQVSAQYFEKIDADYAKEEAKYINRQKVKILVDFTPLINQYPDLSLLRNLPERYIETTNRIKDMLSKVTNYDTEGVIFTLHKNAECNVSVGEATIQIIETLIEIESIVSQYGVKMYIQNRNSFLSNVELMQLLNEKIPAIKFIYQSSIGICADESVKSLNEKGKVSGYSLSAPFSDKFNQKYSANLPISRSVFSDQIKELYRYGIDNNVDFVIFSAEYKSLDEIYADLKYVMK